MGERTKIAWCDSTWNWARGCDKVSPGCKNCYITESLPFKFSGQKHGDPRIIASDSTFESPLAWNKKPWICDACGHAFSHPQQHECPTISSVMAFADETNWHRRRVFSLSLGDWLDTKIPIQSLARAMQIIFQCQELDFLLCSKRLENWSLLMFELWDDDHCKFGARPWIKDWLDGKPPKNVWILGSGEDQFHFTKRATEVMRIPAVVHGMSCEPLLGPIDISNKAIRNGYSIPTAKDSNGYGCEWTDPGDAYVGIDWVIVGGESGENARHCNIDWIRSIKVQCWDAKVPVFVKQLGSFPVQDLSAVMPEADITDPESEPADIAAWEYNRHNALMRLKHPKGGDPSEWPEDLRLQQFPQSSHRD